MDCKECKNVNDKREYAWKYFEYHAKQRMSTFNFFMIAAALITSSIIQCVVSKKNDIDFIIIIGGVCLMCISFIFWKLDLRNKNLIYYAEEALKALEDIWGECDKTHHSIRIFSRENFLTKNIHCHPIICLN